MAEGKVVRSTCNETLDKMIAQCPSARTPQTQLLCDGMCLPQFANHCMICRSAGGARCAAPPHRAWPRCWRLCRDAAQHRCRVRLLRQFRRADQRGRGRRRRWCVAATLRHCLPRDSALTQSISRHARTIHLLSSRPPLRFAGSTGRRPHRRPHRPDQASRLVQVQHGAPMRYPCAPMQPDPSDRAP
jgi:hypothetical protein